MEVYVLILMMHVGALGDGNSNALTTAEYNSKATCEAAGQVAKAMASGTVKEIKFVCTKK
jgi:hypothetical protein